MVITSNVTCNYAGSYADFALQVIFEPYLAPSVPNKYKNKLPDPA